MPKVGRRSDQTLVDYWYGNKSVIQKNAPFGTSYTPTFKVKIIGGKRVPVIENVRNDISQDFSQASSRGGYTARASPTLAPLTEKPNHIDPSQYSRQPVWGFSSAQQDNFNSQVHGLPTRYSIVPPIGYGRNVDGVKMERPTSNLEGPGILNQQQTTVLPEFQEEELYRYLPQGYLPERPIILTEDEEVRLRQSIYRNLKGMELDKLKDVYREITNSDKPKAKVLDPTLSGYITYHELIYLFVKHGIHIPPQTFRLLAGVHMSEKEPDRFKVNYENILKFLAESLRDTTDHSHHPTKGPDSPRRGQLPPDRSPERSPERSPRSLAASVSPQPSVQQRSTYYNPILQEGERYTKGQLKYQSDQESKLMRMLEAAIRNHDEEIHIESILDAFRGMDNDRRGTLSEKQIKEVTISRFHLPLQDSLIDKILSLCERRHGQYNWDKFVRIIERVLPAHTGLNIPRSKRPLEYAKQFPTPGLNWPKYETPGYTPLPTGSRYTPRARSPIRQSQHNTQGPDIYTHSNELQQNDLYTQSNDQRANEEIHPNDYLPPLRHPHDDDRERLEQKINGQKHLDLIEQKLQNLETMYQQTKKELRGYETLPWFERFMMLAKAMYKMDSEDSGFLDSKGVKWLLEEYNDTYNLNFSRDEMMKQMRHFSFDHADGQQVQIHDLLKALSLKGEAT